MVAAAIFLSVDRARLPAVYICIYILMEMDRVGRRKESVGERLQSKKLFVCKQQQDDVFYLSHTHTQYRNSRICVCVCVCTSCAEDRLLNISCTARRRKEKDQQRRKLRRCVSLARLGSSRRHFK